MPGLLAACGGSKSAATTTGGDAAAREDAALLQLDALHRHQQQDEVAPVAPGVPEEVRHPRRLRRGHQRQRGVLREDPGRALARPVDQPRHHRPHRQRPLPVADDQEGLDGEARQVGDPEHQEPRRGAAASDVRPGSRVLVAMAVGDDGHRLQRQAHRPGAFGHRPAREPQAEGQDHVPQLDGRRAHARDARERRRSVASHRQVVQRRLQPYQEGRRRQADPPVHRQRLCAVAREGRPRGGDVLVRRHRADRQQPHPLERAEGRRRALDGQHADPEGRQRLHRVGLHELRVRPEGPGTDRGRRPEAEHHRRRLHPTGHRGEAGGAQARPVRGEQRADLPVGGDALSGPPLRQRCVEQPEVPDAVAEPDLGLVR